ncbi:3-hydroxyanthranilate 3,4-dioxygenase [Flavobacteriaceae bacterium]|jgi:3-hydroxyanthranilate 3,4-dioxygenase|nr:3-hydroxyanthranilate 3,4-dioxygenase [Flavobacteriaceae bacterium]MDC1355734.1 3-hydroxyanthranilate 3,4-dioxygenase [Flavobacteriaceae bacterium]MDC1472461.1 3-hydroxyanthranilate 3,4-dioxygenase [Flavobacteriaceae bacterium]MDC1539101.1 3-hydroxyanthranilate 3,4-dioxygenase [Flavobacteriaceae bacterium]
MSKLVSPLNIKAWIEDHRALLKPPVGNKCVWNDGEFIVMVVGGPNNRKDYHYNETPEFFYQLEGDIILKIIDNGTAKDVHIREGDIYLLPSKVPHSPQRGANTVGIVIEYQRPEGVKDALEWYCEKCNHKLFRAPFTLDNIETDMPLIFDQYYSSKEKCTCSKCGNIMEAPNKI